MNYPKKTNNLFQVGPTLRGAHVILFQSGYLSSYRFGVQNWVYGARVVSEVFTAGCVELGTGTSIMPVDVAPG